MTFAPFIAGTIGGAHKSSERRSPIRRVILHHGAVTSMSGLRSTLEGERQVSANYMAAGGRAWGMVPDERRAWTSGSSSDGGKGAAFDHEAITVETQNATGEPDWLISEAEETTLVKLVRYAHDRYGVPLDRDHILGHRELYARYGASYPTACPGGMNIDRIVQRARALTKDQQQERKDDEEMKFQLLRVKGKTAVYAVSPITGEKWHVPNSAYLNLLMQTGLFAKLRDVPQNVFDFELRLYQMLGAADSRAESKLAEVLKKLG